MARTAADLTQADLELYCQHARDQQSARLRALEKRREAAWELAHLAGTVSICVT